MYPILIQIGPVRIFTYGFMFALAVIIGTWLFTREAKRHGLRAEDISDLVFWVVLSGIFGARLYYVFLYPDFFTEDPWEFFRLYNGGLAFQGGFITAVPTALWFLKKKKMALLPTLDLAAPFIALAHAIGRAGCFFNGCCYGREWKWGIYFPAHEARLHPTQIYETLGLLVIFLILRKRQEASRLRGEVFALYLILAGAERFIVEFFRADHAGVYFGLSNYQFISLGILLAGSVMYFKVKSKATPRVL